MLKLDHIDVGYAKVFRDRFNIFCVLLGLLARQHADDYVHRGPGRRRDHLGKVYHTPASDAVVLMDQPDIGQTILDSPGEQLVVRFAYARQMLHTTPGYRVDQPGGEGSRGFHNCFLTGVRNLLVISLRPTRGYYHRPTALARRPNVRECYRCRSSRRRLQVLGRVVTQRSRGTDAITGPTTPLEAAIGPLNKGHDGPSLEPVDLHERGGAMIVLVGYASEHGSTRDIAHRIATMLDKAGNRVETQPLDRVRDVDRYDAVVLGSAIHDQQWLPPATRFVRRNRDVLAGLPVWLFSVGMPGALPRPLRRFAMKEKQKVITNFRDIINPRDHRLFSGVVVPSQLSRMGRVIFRVLGCRYGDFRDWRAIDAWAQDIACALVAAEAPYVRPAEQ